MTTQTSTATNLQGPDLSTSAGKNNANKYFTNFYNTGFNVSASANDAITAFFEQYTQNKTAAQNLASSVLYTAQAQELDPMQILSQFESMPKGQLNNYLVAFLNSNRVPTSVLGTSTGVATSPYVARTILL
jgi:hypothetical protein